MAGDTRPLQSPLSRTVVLRRKGGKQGRVPRRASLRDYGIRIMQRYTKCVPFYRINYLALYSILSFIQRGGRANAARFHHTRIYYSHASFSPSFVFASRMTHRRIIFAARVRLLISSHAFLRVRSLSLSLSFFLSSSILHFLLYSSPFLLFLFFLPPLSPSSLTPHDRREREKDAHGARVAHELAAFCCSLTDDTFQRRCDKCY